LAKKRLMLFERFLKCVDGSLSGFFVVTKAEYKENA